MNKVFALFNLRFQMEQNGAYATLCHLGCADCGTPHKRNPLWSSPLIDLSVYYEHEEANIYNPLFFPTDTE